MNFHKSHKRRTTYFKVNSLENGTLLVANLTPNKKNGCRGIVLKGSLNKYDNKYILFNADSKIDLIIQSRYSLSLVPQDAILATLEPLDHTQDRFNLKKWKMILKFVRKHTLHGDHCDLSAIAKHVSKTLKPIDHTN